MTRKTALAALLLCGCGRSNPADRAPMDGPSPSAHAATTEVQTAPASAGPSTAPPGSPSAAPSSSAVGPAWPEGTKELSLRWLIHPTVSEQYGERPGSRRVHVDLVLRSGRGGESKLQVVSTDVYGTTFFVPGGGCTGEPYGEPNVVGELFLNGAGNHWITVERERGSGAGADSVVVYSHDSTDGLCTDSAGKERACQVDRRELARFVAPRSLASFREKYVHVQREEADAGGHVREVPACGS